MGDAKRRRSEMIRQWFAEGRDARGRSFETSEEDRDPLTTISSPAETAAALVRSHDRSGASWGSQARGGYGPQAQQYAQHAVMLLANPTLPASERAALMSALQRSGSPAYGGNAVWQASTFGPGALPGNVGLIGSRTSLGDGPATGPLKGLKNKIARTAQIVSVFRPRRGDYDYYAVPHGVRLRAPSQPPGRPAFGEALEALLPSLPASAAKVGHGELARGTVVMDRGGATRSIAGWLTMIVDRLEQGGVMGKNQYNDGTGMADWFEDMAREGGPVPYRPQTKGKTRVDLEPMPKGNWGPNGRFVIKNVGPVAAVKVQIVDTRTTQPIGKFLPIFPGESLQVDVPPGLYWIRVKTYIRGTAVRERWQRGGRNAAGETMGYRALQGKALGIAVKG